MVPNNSMSGFCATCHGNFHSSGSENGTSGAFLRHPSDFVIPTTAGLEYEDYTVYNVTALVARPDLAGIGATADVEAGDMVMCLSCHMAHGSENTYLLRFDYDLMVAGSSGAADGTGCLACHTNKD